MEPVEAETRVLAILRDLIRQVGSGRALAALKPEAVLDRDLGIGSLERTELVVRLESAFGVELPDGAIVHAASVADLVRYVVAANPAVVRAPLVAAGVAREPVAPDPPSDAQAAPTLIELLARRAAATPDALHASIRGEDGTETRLTYADLQREAIRIGAALRHRGLKPGAPVGLIFPTSPEFFGSFFGVMMAGGIPVPLYPPHRMDQLEEYAGRQALILANAEARLLLTAARAGSLAEVLQARVPSLEAVVHPGDLVAPPSLELGIPVGPDDLAFLQYTSGSTGLPKGVMLTQANLMANLRAIARGVDLRPSDVVVSWLPLYHDMGLIGCWLGALFGGIPTHIASPMSFLTRPQKWLWAIHQVRGTITAAPNFAYDLCARKLPERALEGLDLSCWRIALNGAEPVLPETVRTFCARLAPYRFAPEAMFPAYGLAENCVALTFPPPARGLKVDLVERDPLLEQRRAAPVAADSGAPRLAFVALGAAVEGSEVRVAREDGTICPEREVGRVHFRGSSASPGYYRNPEATATLIRSDGWRETGDLGYLADGDLYVTGRSKDLIIKAGRNLVPQEIEELVAAVEGVRPGSIAAFSLPGKEGTEALVVVAEVRNLESADRPRIEAQIAERIVAALGVMADEIVLAAHGLVPKTSSGKIRRSACREMYQRGEFRAEVKAGGRWFLVRAAAERGWMRVRHAIGRAARWLYGIYSWATIFLSLLLVCVVMRVMKPSRWSVRIMQAWARSALFAAGLRPRVSGAEVLAAVGPCVLVVNHASYLDVIVLTAALPLQARMVAKAELSQDWVTGAMTRGGRALLVRRDDPQGCLEDAAEIERCMRAGETVLYFPEGTFTPATGIRPFKLGAFTSAARLGLPVVPIAMRGVRQALRDGTKLPRPSRIEVEIGPPIRPDGPSWTDAVRLRDACRAWIAEHAGEPALDLVRAGLPIAGE